MYPDHRSAYQFLKTNSTVVAGGFFVKIAAGCRDFLKQLPVEPFLLGICRGIDVLDQFCHHFLLCAESEGLAPNIHNIPAAQLIELYTPDLIVRVLAIWAWIAKNASLAIVTICCLWIIFLFHFDVLNCD